MISNLYYHEIEQVPNKVADVCVLYMCIYIYIYICICVCMRDRLNSDFHIQNVGFY